MQEKYLSCVPGASLVTAYAALRPRDGYSHPHQEQMKYTYTLNIKALCKNLATLFIERVL